MDHEVPPKLRELVTQVCWSRMPEQPARQLAGTILYRLATDGWLAGNISPMTEPTASRWWITQPKEELVNLSELRTIEKRDMSATPQAEARAESQIDYGIIGYYPNGTGAPVVLWISEDPESREVAWDQLVAKLL